MANVSLDSSVDGSLVEGFGGNQVWMSHGDQVRGVPSGYVITAETDSCPIAAFENNDLKRYGVQFHPEVTPHAERTRRSCAGSSSTKPSWQETGPAKASSKKQWRESKLRWAAAAFCARSAAASIPSVMAALLTKAIGDRAVCVFVDHGLLRKNEAEQVREAFTSHFKPKLLVFDAKDQFFAALKGVTEPESKRKIIGAEFIRVFEVHANEFNDCTFLRKELYIQTSSRAAPQLRPRSSLTITSAACPIG